MGDKFMKCEVIVSTMNKTNKKEIVDLLNINDCVIINQITEDIKVKEDDTKSNQKFLSFKEKGLSRSRNKGLINSSNDICIIADDDMYYESDYEENVLKAYEKYKNADIIAFVVDNENKEHKKKILKEGKINFLKSMKLQSVQITFKRNSIINKYLKFDEKFGAGSTYSWGEENIFLFDCIRKGLKVYYCPIKIATLLDTGISSWDRENTKEHYMNQGAIYYRMSKVLYPILIMQFVLRKRRIYSKDMTAFSVLKSMFKGAKTYKRSI